MTSAHRLPSLSRLALLAVLVWPLASCASVPETSDAVRPFSVLDTRAFQDQVGAPPAAVHAAPTIRSDDDDATAVDLDPSPPSGEAGALTADPAGDEPIALSLGAVAPDPSTGHLVRRQDPQDTPTAENPRSPDFDPQTNEFDWIKLTTGEWLCGEIKGLRADVLTFDSENLDTIDFDWGDIAEVWSQSTHLIMIDGRITHEGDTLLIKDGTVYLGEGAEQQTFTRDELRSIVPGEDEELNYWSGRFSLGAVVRSGNVNQADYTAYAFIRRETPATRWDSSYNGALSKIGGTETANNHRINSRFDWFLTGQFYVTPIGITYYRDVFQNIEYRITPFAGVGYDIFNKAPFKWTVLGGAAYQRTSYRSVLPPASDHDDTAAAIFETRAEWDITSDIEWDTEYSLTVPVPGAERNNHHFATYLAIDLAGDFILDLGLIWDRVGDPVPDINGDVPQENDLRFTLGVGYSF